jgi:hypothetical protein
VGTLSSDSFDGLEDFALWPVGTPVGISLPLDTGGQVKPNRPKNGV